MSEENLTIETYQNINTPSALGHMLLAGISGNALSYISMKNEPFAFTAASALFGYGMYGSLIKAHTSLIWYPYLKNLYDWMRLGIKSFSLPLMNCHFGRLIHEDDTYIYAHLASGFAPLVYGLGRKYTNSSLALRTERITDIVVLGNACSLGYIGATHESPFALSLAFWQMFIQYFPSTVQNYIERCDIEILGMSVVSLILVLMFRHNHSPVLGTSAQ